MGFFSSTESPDLNRIGSQSWPVRLSSRVTIGLDEVEYDYDANRFYYGDLDVTALLTTPQRLAFPSYAEAGIVRTNEANYVEKTGDTSSGGSTSVLNNFVDGVGSDLAGISGGIRKFVAGDPENPGSMSALKKLGIAAIIGGLMFLGWEIITAIKAK